jgi:hypothetical protein
MGDFFLFLVFRLFWLLPLIAGPIAGVEAYHYLRLKYKLGKHILSEEQQLELSQAKSNLLKFSVIFFLTVVLVFFT